MVSCVALRLACMCGRATFAIVVSSTCSSTAIITPTVTISRSPRGSGWVATLAGVSAIGQLLLLGLVEIDRGGDRQASDHRPRRRAVECDPHRHALHHLD